MGRRAQIALGLPAALAVLGGVGCGSQGVQVGAGSEYHHGAQLFADHCSGCHSLAVVGARGSAQKTRDRERINGPNFNVRHEQVSEVLYAIRNGGFSGAIMPQNIVVGGDAQALAQFLAKYSGKQAPSGK